MPEVSNNSRRWIIVALAFAAIMLNYVDRQIIALLKPTLQVEFGWSNRDYSHMASAFQFSAALAFLGAGWFIDRIGLRRGFALGVGTWSVAGMAHALVTTVGGFVGARVVLGAAEAIGTPAQVKTAAAYFPAEQRSMMLGIGNMAANLGAVVAPLAIPPLALALGWRAAFLITGGLGLVWVAVWLLVPPPHEAQRDAAEGTRVPWKTMLGDRRQWALVAAKNVLGRGVVVPALLFTGPVPPPLRHEPGSAGGSGGVHLYDGRARLALRRLAADVAAEARREREPRAQGIDAGVCAADPACASTGVYAQCGRRGGAAGDWRCLRTRAFQPTSSAWRPICSPRAWWARRSAWQPLPAICPEWR